MENWNQPQLEQKRFQSAKQIAWQGQHCLWNFGQKVWLMSFSVVCYSSAWLMIGESALAAETWTNSWRQLKQSWWLSLQQQMSPGSVLTLRCLFCSGFVNFVNFVNWQGWQAVPSLNCNESTLPATSSHQPCITPSNHHWILLGPTCGSRKT